MQKLSTFVKRHARALTLALLCALILLIALGGIGYAYEHGMFGGKPQSIHGYAQLMVDRCAKAAYRPTCYENEVPTLVTDLTMPQIFDVIREIRKIDPDYLYCHVLAHKLGTYEVSLDPNNWLNAVAEGPTDGLCSNGFAHGAILTRFHDEQLTKDQFDYAVGELATACEEREGWHPTDLTKAMCYHGLGHVLIFMSEANVPAALAACEKVALKSDGRDYRQLCTEGVYMQLYQPLEPEDYALIDKLPLKPTKDDLKQFCSQNSANNAQYGACWREGWPVIGNDIKSGKGISNHCNQLTDAEGKDLCFISLVTINGRQNLGTPDNMVRVCSEMDDAHKGTCFARGANAYLEEDPQLVPQGVALCARADTQAAQDECYGFLANVASFNFGAGSPAFVKLCSLLPQKWQGACARQ